MKFEDFVELLSSTLSTDLVLKNPGKGTSTIIRCDRDRIYYRRGKSTFSIRLKDLYAAYLNFVGKDVTTRQLKDYAPQLFDSASGGHNCNATFMFLALNRAGLGSKPWGRGRVGAPFGITVHSN